MRKTIALTLFLLLAAWAVGQQTTPSAPPDHSQSQAQSQSQPGADQSQSASPSQSQSGAASSQDKSAIDPADAQIVQGCLGGSNPNFTITAKDGTKYDLKVPQGADVSPLQSHIGESVAVQGVVDNGSSASNSSSAKSGSIAGSENAQSSNGATKSIRAMRIGRGTGTCPAGAKSGSGSNSGASGANSGSSTTPPPPAKQ